MIYQDKRGKVIQAGDTIKHDNGDVEMVYDCGDNNLGINASNKSSSAYYGLEECYPLSEFDLNEWKIIERGENNEE